MPKLTTVGRGMFALGILALGFLCFIFEDFIIGRPPKWPEGFTLNPALAYISATVAIAACVSIFLNKKGAWGALVIALLILLLTIFRHLPQFTDWLNTYKALALIGGSLIIAYSYYKEGEVSGLLLRWGASAWRYIFFAGCIPLAVFFIASGYAHIKFAEFVIGFIPAYIPFHTFFTYFCALCLFAGGVGILIPSTRKWAALMSGFMLAGWFLLLHIPRFITNINDASDRMGLCESFAFAGIFFVIAGVEDWKIKRLKD